MNVEDILAKLVSFPVLGGDSNLSIIHWIKEYIETFEVATTLVPNNEGTKAFVPSLLGTKVVATSKVSMYSFIQ